MIHQISFEEYAAGEIPTPFEALVKASPTLEVQEAFIKHRGKFQDGYYKRIVVSVSGGADSDRLIDFVERIGYPKGTVHYVFFDTGIEYKATKDHLIELEKKYGITIERIRAKVPVSMACHKYGLPFLSKRISDYIYRLQLHDFKWEDRPFEELYTEYPKCKAALKWWCNLWGEGSSINISRRKWLKEFLVAHPPDFLISKKCCEKAKVDVARDYQKEKNADLDVVGLRKAEGGTRSTGIHSCFSEVAFGCDALRPLFWFKKTDCTAYDETFNICHSDCYTEYGLKRTGCACCPFGKDFEMELEAAKKYEPSLYTVANAIFGKSYEYTRMYREFVKEMDAKVAMEHVR